MIQKVLLFLLLATSVLTACQNSFTPKPKRNNLGSSKGSVSADSTSRRNGPGAISAPPPVSSLVAECNYSETFWPRGTRLSSTEWTNHCTQFLSSREVNDNLFVTRAEESSRDTCAVCLDDDRPGLNLACGCNSTLPTMFYCYSCLSDNVANGSTDCRNTNECNKLLPYPIILRASTKRFGDAIEERGVELADDDVDRAIQASREVFNRYLSQLVARVSVLSGSNFKIVSCTRENCVFQALVERDRALPVPCYFHIDNHICVRCSGNYSYMTDHRCRLNEVFKNAEERREVHSIRCPNPDCGVETQRNAGCMHMTCPQCHHHWCWYCAWHFFDAPEGEHGDKRASYATEDLYRNGHLQRFHDGQLIFFANDNFRTGSHPYLRHCNKDSGCPCKASFGFDNPFRF